MPSVTKVPYVYVFVREEIPIADQIVQVGHACIEAGKKFKHPPGTHLVLLSIYSRSRLEDVSWRLDLHNINHVRFYEPDEGMGLTAIATKAVYSKDREIFKNYDLWKI